MRTPALLAAVAVLVACERLRESEPPTCDTNVTLVTDSAIGPLHIGEAVGALRERCSAILDTTVSVRLTGFVDSAQALRLMVVGFPVLAFHEGERVTALQAFAPPFKTRDSVGVGTSIAQFRGKSGVRVDQSTHAAEPLLRDRSRCGMSFGLSAWGSPPPLTEGEPPLMGSALAAWPDSIVVTRIEVTGCRGITDPGVDSLSEAMSDSARLDSLGNPLLPPLPMGGATATSPPLRPLPSSSGVLPGADTGGVPASARELAELRALLDVPVRGIPRSQIRDTYAEARGSRTHEALDIAAPRGTEVLSAADGTLRKLHNSRAGGLMVYAADPSDRFVLLYGHLDRYADGLTEGMPLRRGQVIGYVGTTGNAPLGTPHLHFAILRGKPSVAWWRGTAINPYALLKP